MDDDNTDGWHTCDLCGGKFDISDMDTTDVCRGCAAGDDD